MYICNDNIRPPGTVIASFQLIVRNVTLAGRNTNDKGKM